MGNRPSLDDIFGAQSKSERPSLDNIFQSAEPPQPEPDSFGKSLVRGTLDALPIAGGAGAGLLASETGPGAIPAAGLGYAAGKQLQKLGHKYLLGEESPEEAPLEQATNVGKDIIDGATYEMGGQAVSAATNPVFSFLKNKFSPPAPAPMASPTFSAGPLVDQFGKNIPSTVPDAPAVVPSVASKPSGGLGGVVSDLGSLASAAWHKDPVNMLSTASRLSNRVGAPQAAGNAIGKLSGVLASNPEALGTYSQPLLKAMQGGEHSLAVTDFLMGQSDPQYRQKRDSLLQVSDNQ